MKNLANCTPREFLAQTSRMSDALENWINVTDVMNIRRNVPELPEVPDIDSSSTPEELAAHDEAIKERNRIVRKAAMDNMFAIIRSAFKTHPEETLQVVAYACFIPLDEIDNYKMSEIMRNVTEIISDQDVIDFFVSLRQLDQKIGA